MDEAHPMSIGRDNGCMSVGQDDGWRPAMGTLKATRDSQIFPSTHSFVSEMVRIGMNSQPGAIT